MIWANLAFQHPVDEPSQRSVTDGQRVAWRTVALMRNGRFYCSGTLIAPQVVLTARHCRAPAAVAFGANVAAPVLVATVDVSLPHPSADLQLLGISADPGWETGNLPWRVPSRDDGPHGELLITGFGASSASGDSGAGTLRASKVPAEGWGCDPAAATCRPGRDLVAQASEGRDTCNGDSGGPIFEYAVVAADTLPTWRLVGVTSHALVPGDATCGQGGVYTRVDTATGWLIEGIHQMNKRSR